MINVDYIIVGGGYAGIFFAHQLIKNNRTFIIFSENGKSASQVSAGIVNPVVLKKFTTFWLANEQIDFLNKTLSEVTEYTGRNYLINENIHRIFHDKSEQELWLKKSDTEELQPFLYPEFKSLKTVLNPFATGSVNLSARLNVQAFFDDFNAFFKKDSHLREDRFDYSKISGNTYDDISFKHIVFCEGIGVKKNPFFSEIPVTANKGHHLKVKLPEPLDHQLTLKKKKWSGFVLTSYYTMKQQKTVKYRKSNQQLSLNQMTSLTMDGILEKFSTKTNISKIVNENKQPSF